MGMNETPSGERVHIALFLDGEMRENRVWSMR